MSGRGVISAAITVVALAVVGLLAWIWLTPARPGPQPLTVQEPQEPPPVTPPLDFAGFDAGNIISDEEFFAADAMDEGEVAAFINTWNKGCRPGPDDTPCLADFQEDTDSYEPDQYCPDGFKGGKGQSAAAIITQAAQSCGINPQVLLVTLQKEQGLITAYGPRLQPSRYAIAMGYACPDSTHCDKQFYGFANQVYHAARQMRIYEAYPENYSVKPAAEAKIAYAAEPDCGSSKVMVENQATANLYNYTPYQPNEDALQGGYGGCASPGNLNFYAYYNAWFAGD